METDLDDAVVRDADQFNISAIVLNGRTDQFNDFANLPMQVRRNSIYRRSWQSLLLIFQLPQL